LNFNHGNKPRFELSSTPIEKSMLTLGLNEYIRNGYIKIPRTTGDVVHKFSEDFKLNTASSDVCVILKRLTSNRLQKLIKKEGLISIITRNLRILSNYFKLQNIYRYRNHISGNNLMT